MKWIQLVSLCLFVFTGIYGCEASEENTEVSSKKEVPKAASEAENTDKENSNWLSPGNFETIKEKQDLGTDKSGPLTFEMRGAYLQEGTLKEGFVRDRYGKEVEVVVFMMRTNADHIDLLFDEDHFSLKTDTGEEVAEPSGLLSSAIYPLALDVEDRRTQVTFVLEETKVGAIEEMQLTISPPTTEEGESLGEKVIKNIAFE
jgi:hypothetical protein